MKRVKKMLLYTALVVLGILTVLFFSLGLHRKPQSIQNFEEEEYGRQHPFVDPLSVVDGLAVYTAGSGEPLLLFPYPHGHTTEPMAQGPLAGRNGAHITAGPINPRDAAERQSSSSGSIARFRARPYGSAIHGRLIRSSPSAFKSP